MDAADRWLREHDPDYDMSRAAWPHLNEDGAYERPWQEILWDDPTREPEETLEPREERVCGRLRCAASFIPREAKHRYCSDRCRETEKKRRQRSSR